MSEHIPREINSRESFTRKHKPRTIPKPTGWPDYGRDPYTDHYIGRFASDPPFRFWIVDGSLKPIKRATLDMAWRCGKFSPELEWARMKQREETT